MLKKTFLQILKRISPVGDEVDDIRIHYNRLWAEEQVSGDIRVYAKNSEKLQELLAFTFNGERIITFADYPKDCSPEQGEKDGMFVVIHGKVFGNSMSVMEQFLENNEI